MTVLADNAPTNGKGWVDRLPVMLSILGLATYLSGRVGSIVFYAQFDVSPADVGFDQAATIETAALLGLAAVLVAVTLVVIGAYVAIRGYYGLVLASALIAAVGVGGAQHGASTTLTLLGIFVAAGAVAIAAWGTVGLLTGSGSARWRAVALLAAATILPVGIGTCAWQYGIKAKAQGDFNLSPFASIRVDEVCLSSLEGRSTPRSALPRHPLLLLGFANGVAVFYDKALDAPLRVPETSLLIRGAVLGQHAPRAC